MIKGLYVGNKFFPGIGNKNRTEKEIKISRIINDDKVKFDIPYVHDPKGELKAKFLIKLEEFQLDLIIKSIEELEEGKTLVCDIEGVKEV